MKINENISRIRSLMNVNESTYFKRRFSASKLEEFLNLSLDGVCDYYHSVDFRGGIKPTLRKFRLIVVSTTLDLVFQDIVDTHDETTYDTEHEFDSFYKKTASLIIDTYTPKINEKYLSCFQDL